MREKPNNKDHWKQIIKVAVQRSDNETSLTPTKGKPEEEQSTFEKGYFGSRCRAL